MDVRLFPEFSLPRMAEDRFSPEYTRKLTTKVTSLGFGVGDTHFSLRTDHCTMVMGQEKNNLWWSYSIKVSQKCFYVENDNLLLGQITSPWLCLYSGKY